MQNEITSGRELLDENGRVNGEGYAVLPHWRYRRAKVRAPWWRIKEWDYYAVLDQTSGFGVTITASDLGYAGLFALCLVDLSTGRWEQVDTLTVMPAGRTGFAETADEDNRVRFRDNRLYLELVRDGQQRILRFASEAFRGFTAGPVSGEISLRQPEAKPRMVIATSWKENRRAFYYNQKINCMPAEGSVKTGAVEHRFSAPGSFGTLDWGRGNWTYRNRWYWASASGMVEGVPFGFNLGYGFSDRSPASENMLFYNNLPHKLGEVEFRMDSSDYMKPWLFSSGDGRFEAEFVPALDRSSRTDLLLIKSVQHQCFGHYSGAAVLDDGSRVRFHGFPGFAEDVYNRW